jgi:proteic killer suppression protein
MDDQTSCNLIIRRRQHSIRINAQWRICFVWREDGAHEVEIVDYH